MLIIDPIIYFHYRMNSAVQEQNQNTLASPYYYLSSGLRVLE
jgi:hypothetical protein